ncbi:MAG: type II toxin-antitoxin system RelE/ParE family toxin [Candidatus Berkelbacteria bacterium]|nr:type II toxin-antitoxin system RelE/ParE family toxin [Candidatus Berkelbacteria bacterium]
MYTVVIKKTAGKALKSLPQNDRRRIIQAINMLGERPESGKQLSRELAGLFSIRVWPYRVIYRRLEKKLLVEVVKIGHRKGIYK